MEYIAVGNYVVLRAVEEKPAEDKITENGLILPAQFNERTTGQVINNPNKNGKIRVKLFIESIGSGVDPNIYNFKVGDRVIVNDYDVQPQGGDDGEIFALCKIDSIKAIIK